MKFREPYHSNHLIPHRVHRRVCKTGFSSILFNELLRFLGESETDNFTVSNSEIIAFTFPVSENRIFL